MFKSIYEINFYQKIKMLLTKIINTCKIIPSSNNQAYSRLNSMALTICPSTVFMISITSFFFYYSQSNIKFFTYDCKIRFIYLSDDHILFLMNYLYLLTWDYFFFWNYNYFSNWLKACLDFSSWDRSLSSFYLIFSYILRISSYFKSF